MEQFVQMMGMQRDMTDALGRALASGPPPHRSRARAQSDASSDGSADGADGAGSPPRKSPRKSLRRTQKTRR